LGVQEDSVEVSGEAVASVVERALEAYRALAELGERVEDEWQYVNDLLTVHSADMRALVNDDGGRVLPAERVAAVDALIAEVALLADPHRAIDWLSTFPQVLGLAVAPQASVP